MSRVRDIYSLPQELVLGTRLNARIPKADQKRQRAEVKVILNRLRTQPGVILADEVGMGKTFVALAVAYSVASRSPRGPVIVMVPANLIDKWEQDLKTFFELYIPNRHPIRRDRAEMKDLKEPTAIRYGVARHSVELMKLLDDPRPERCHLIFLTQGAMGRRQTNKWVRLALIAEALRIHGRGGANRLIQVKKQIHRFLAELLKAIGEERSQDLGEELWKHLLRTHPSSWRDIYNDAVRDRSNLLNDDPVPKDVTRALQKIHLGPLAEALKQMPIRARGEDDRVSERINDVRQELRLIEEELWKKLLAQASWRSSLLVMDEAHHLKNRRTALAMQLQSPELEQDLRTGDGAMAKAFDRMLFLTATPFQLGHHELVSVLSRFGDVRWNPLELGDQLNFHTRLNDLSKHLDESQRAAIALQRSWSRLRPEDCDCNIKTWWDHLLLSSRESLTSYQRAVVDTYDAARRSRNATQEALRPWIIRHNKGIYWADTQIFRRLRVEGAAISNLEASTGLPIPPQQLLPFFLAARSAINPKQDLLGEALCSSYEAFRFTRQNRDAAKDEQEELTETYSDLSHSRWYLGEFDHALDRCTGSAHPKVDATVRRVVDLWEEGEKVLVFAFYRQTCRALRIHISREIEQRIMSVGLHRLRKAGRQVNRREVKKILQRIQNRFFDDADSPGRRAIDLSLHEIIQEHAKSLKEAQVSEEQINQLKDVMRRFLRVTPTLIRCFPISDFDMIKPAKAVRKMMAHNDRSHMSWRQKFDGFIEFLTTGCSTEERKLYLDAAERTQTGGIRVERDDEEGYHDDEGTVTLANVQIAMGTTRRDARSRLMRAFNTPFFPDILVCSEVMGEGVDLQRFCRHIIHHDLAWNPSTIEQRTGRIDRLGCKAEGRHPIVVYLPFLDGAADERQYRVMSEREQWFHVVMGQNEVARLITPDSSSGIPLPETISEELSFKLGLDSSRY